MGAHCAIDGPRESPQSQPGPRFHVLLADDDPEMRTLLEVALRGEGYEVTGCANGPQLLAQLNVGGAAPVSQRIDLVITDMRMPGVSGLEILRRLHGRRDLPPIVLITAFGDELIHIQAQEFGAVATIDKPFDIAQFLAVVREVLEPSTG